MATKEYTHTIVTQAYIVSLKHTWGGRGKKHHLSYMVYLSLNFSPSFSPSPLKTVRLVSIKSVFSGNITPRYKHNYPLIKKTQMTAAL